MKKKRANCRLNLDNIYPKTFYHEICAFGSGRLLGTIADVQMEAGAHQLLRNAADSAKGI